VIITNINWGGFVMQQKERCPHCYGTGHSNLCPSCGGNGVARGTETLDIEMLPGIPEQKILIFPKRSDEVPGYTPGAVVVEVTTHKNPRFTRDSNNVDLHTQITVTLLEALVGFKKQIFHLDEHIVNILSENPIQPGDIITIKGEGMPAFDNPQAKGSLFVKVEVKFPDAITKKQEQGIIQLLDKQTSEAESEIY